LVIEGIHLRRSAVHVEEDDVAGTRRKVLRLRRRAGALSSSGLLGHQGCQRHRAKAVGTAEKHFSPGQGWDDEASAVHDGISSRCQGQKGICLARNKTWARRPPAVRYWGVRGYSRPCRSRKSRQAADSNGLGGRANAFWYIPTMRSSGEATVSNTPLAH